MLKRDMEPIKRIVFKLYWLTDRLKLFKLFIDDFKISKLFTLYYVLFLIFFTFNASYYIGPKLSSPAFASYYVEESPAASWSNISSTVLDLFDNFVPDLFNTLPELS